MPTLKICATLENSMFKFVNNFVVALALVAVFVWCFVKFSFMLRSNETMTVRSVNHED